MIPRQPKTHELVGVPGPAMSATHGAVSHGGWQRGCDQEINMCAAGSRHMCTKRNRKKTGNRRMAGIYHHSLHICRNEGARVPTNFVCLKQKRTYHLGTCFLPTRVYVLFLG